MGEQESFLVGWEKVQGKDYALLGAEKSFTVGGGSKGNFGRLVERKYKSLEP